MGFDDEVALVTGGRGFAARHLVNQLIQKTEYHIRIMDLAPQMTLSEEELEGILGQAFADNRVAYVSADLTNRQQVFDVCKGVDVVFHMAAPDSSINKFELHYEVTVKGTRNVVDACIEHGVRKLIYTSSPSVVFDGKTPIVNADESLPIPDKHNDFYSEAKAQAEAVVLSSNGKNGLLTCAIRPSGIFGPGDRLSVPKAVEAAKSGKLKFIIGDGKNMFDWTYVENVANAHICADNSLRPEDEGEMAAAGKAYFITNGEPIRFWEFFVLVLEGLGYPSPKYCLPVKLLMPFAYLVDWVCKRLAPFGVPPSQFTPTRLRIMSTPRTFNISRAKKLLGYDPPVPLHEGIKRTIASYPHLRAEVQEAPKIKERSGPSKTRLMLGSETVADVLLWTDTRQTLTVLSGLSFLAYLFLASGYTLITLLANFAYMGLIVLFIYSRLPESLFGVTVPRIPPLSEFQIPEEKAERVALALGSIWNQGAGIVSTLQKGESWSLFFKSLVVLRFMKFLGGYSLQTLIMLALLSAFTVPYFYEQHDDEVDKFVEHAREACGQYKGLVLAKLPGSVKKYLHH
ncbi:plant 3beta-hydroxysteroid-4alpha-carboxylate 3-dehydrogenase [Marchantia polymorpha subsp. ruderalis]|uniref:Reticulon-like protein n=2 Tax=Marchantia polymorpha TaxID=3197 RepID=A0A176VCV6_MARPO|nr:hypothetical protein AXG93_2727s1290 [Marchantia polymorpha subsp. ruderalis]PTQ49953.1 hypothetical protein MARPO_0001s0030 [Marchantia polymorpha]BBM98877.1 hypothetical protein Mp_1g16900 [Marchantia polymorpha subsp. ruderalis]|eukprot:PTQ49953.1 hypothetical protein MARPO_0001s0030 [Marchantia polymorpha]